MDGLIQSSLMFILNGIIISFTAIIGRYRFPQQDRCMSVDLTRK